MAVPNASKRKVGFPTKTQKSLMTWFEAHPARASVLHRVYQNVMSKGKKPKSDGATPP